MKTKTYLSLCAAACLACAALSVHAECYVTAGIGKTTFPRIAWDQVTTDNINVDEGTAWGLGGGCFESQYFGMQIEYVDYGRYMDYGHFAFEGSDGTLDYSQTYIANGEGKAHGVAVMFLARYPMGAIVPYAGAGIVRMTERYRISYPPRADGTPAGVYEDKTYITHPIKYTVGVEMGSQQKHSGDISFRAEYFTLNTKANGDDSKSGAHGVMVWLVSTF